MVDASGGELPIVIRPLGSGHVAPCEQLLRSLPDWFGIEASLRAYVRDLTDMETFVAEGEGALAGFITLRRHNPSSAEIQVLAVRRQWHRRNIGTRLVRHVEGLLAGLGVGYLQVKTLGPSRDSAPYAATRGFYLRCGFVPLEENRLWGEANPCLVMVKHLACGGWPDGTSRSGPSVHR